MTIPINHVLCIYEEDSPNNFPFQTVGYQCAIKLKTKIKTKTKHNFQTKMFI